ncbi:MAG: hypothetical protein HY094_07340 [Candidatus Melainabacteria bacterium]|nr:hypothetical protein [Candidatus Melainabacteria bacterium]
MTLEQVVVANVPRLTQLAKGLLGHLSNSAAVVNTVEQAGEIVAKASSVTETVARTVADSGASQSLFGAGQLSELKEFVGALNGQASPVEKQLLDTITRMLEQGLEIDPENKRGLEEILKRVSLDDSARVYTQEELDTEVEKKVEAELKKRVDANREKKPEELAPVEKIITGIGGIVTGEFRNMSSEAGWLMKGFCKWKGIKIDEEAVNGYLRSFADENFKGNLEKYIKAKVSGHKDPISACSNLTENEETAVGWVGTLISIGGSTPSWVFDGVAMLGTIIDYGAEFLHGIPILGRLLKLPFGRKLITGVGQFAGRFAKDIQLIGNGAKELKAQISK